MNRYNFKVEIKDTKKIQELLSNIKGSHSCTFISLDRYTKEELFKSETINMPLTKQVDDDYFRKVNAGPMFFEPLKTTPKGWIEIGYCSYSTAITNSTVLEEIFVVVKKGKIISYYSYYVLLVVEDSYFGHETSWKTNSLVNYYKKGEMGNHETAEVSHNILSHKGKADNIRTLIESHFFREEEFMDESIFLQQKDIWIEKFADYSLVKELEVQKLLTNVEQYEMEP